MKYLGFIMQADNAGEGGILALLALVPERKRKGRLAAHRLDGGARHLRRRAALRRRGDHARHLGARARSKGSRWPPPPSKPWVIPLTCVILVRSLPGAEEGDRRHRAGLRTDHGRVVSDARGPRASCRSCAYPAVLGAVIAAARRALLSSSTSWHGFLVLGAVVLVITGGEALYADMGHFGRRPIRLAWFSVVMPALLLNYFGQGALLLDEPRRRRRTRSSRWCRRCSSTRWSSWRRWRPSSRRRRSSRAPSRSRGRPCSSASFRA